MCANKLNTRLAHCRTQWKDSGASNVITHELSCFVICIPCVNIRESSHTHVYLVFIQFILNDIKMYFLPEVFVDLVIYFGEKKLDSSIGITTWELENIGHIISLFPNKSNNLLFGSIREFPKKVVKIIRWKNFLSLIDFYKIYVYTMADDVNQ